MRMRIAMVPLVAVMFLGGTAVGQTAPAATPLEIKATLKVADPWIAGTVCWAEITFQNALTDPVPVLGNLGFNFKFDSFVLTLTEKRSGKVIVSKEVPQVVQMGGRVNVASTPFLVPAKGTMSIPFRIPWPKENPPAGTYELAIRPISNTVLLTRNQPRSVAFKGATDVVVREATEEEKPFLARPEVMAVYPFGDWEADLTKMPESLRKHLGMDLELRRLFKTPQKADPGVQEYVSPSDKSQVRQFDADKIGVGLPEFYKPLIGVLRYQVLLAQDRANDARAVKEDVLKAAPGYAWLCANAEGKQGERGLIARGRVRYEAPEK